MNRKMRWGFAVLMAWIATAFVPWAPVFRPEYCEQQTHWAFARHWQYGRDIVFNSGPLGFLGVPMYDPATYPILLLVHLVTFAFSAYVIHLAYLRFIGLSRWNWLYVGCVLIPLCLSPVDYWTPLNCLPFVLGLLLVLLHFCCDDTWETPAKYLLIAGLGFAMWVKSNLGPVLLASIASIAIDEVWRLKRLPRSLIVFGVSLSAGWWLGHQGTENILPNWHYTREFVVGYRDALALWSFTSTVFGLIFLGAVLTTGYCLYRVCLAQIGYRALVPLLMWYFTGYVVFLHGIVRSGGEHMVTSWLTLLSAIIMIGPWVLTHLRRRGLLRIAGLLVIANIAFSLGIAENDRLAVGRLLLVGPRGLAHLLRVGPGGLRANHQRELARLQLAGAALNIRGPAEMPAGNPGILLLTPGLRSRPTIVTIGAITHDLIELNRLFLQSASAPETIVFSPYAIDDNFPTMADSASYVTMATNYRLRLGSGNPLIFEKSTHVRGVHRSELFKKTVHFGQIIELDQVSTLPLWISFDLHPNLLGTVLSNTFKPPPVALEVVVDGRTIRKRLKSLPASGGMLVSPYLEKASDFRDFYSEPSRKILRHRVTALSVVRSEIPILPTTTWFHDRIDVRVATVVFEVP